MKEIITGPLIVEDVSRETLVPLDHNGITQFKALNIGGTFPHQRSHYFFCVKFKKKLKIAFVSLYYSGLKRITVIFKVIYLLCVCVLANVVD